MRKVACSRPLSSRAGHTPFFRAFVLASARTKKERGSVKTNACEKGGSGDHERKKAKILAFSAICRTTLEAHFQCLKSLTWGKSKGLG